MFSQVFEKPNIEAKDKEDASTLQAEYAEQRQVIQKQYGWFFLAKEIADYANTGFFDILDRSVIDVLGLYTIMQAKITFNSIK